MVERLRSDAARMQEILEPIGPDEWGGFMVTHAYMGPVPAFLFAAGQLMDFGVHSWDIREGLGMTHALSADVADLLVPFMFEIWRGTVREGAGKRALHGGDPGLGPQRRGHEGDHRAGRDELRARRHRRAARHSSSSTPGSFVLTTFGRVNAGTVHGDTALAQRFLSSFFRI